MSTVLDYASAATIVTPPDQWILAGQSSNSPYLAAYHVWVAVETLGLISPMYDMYDSTGPGWFVNKITPYGYPTKLGTAVNDGIFLAAGAADTYGVQIQAYEDRDVRLQVVDSSSATKHFWRWKRDGVLAISGTTQVQGLQAGPEATSKLRYAYPATAYPVFRLEMSPFLGGWTLVTANSAMGATGSGTWYINGTGGSPYPATMRIPVRFDNDTSRPNGAVVHVATKLGVEDVKGFGGTPTISVSFRRVSTTTGSDEVIFSVSTASGSFVSLSDTTEAGAGYADIVPRDYAYFLEVTAANVTAGIGAEIRRIYLEIEKHAVE